MTDTQIAIRPGEVLAFPAEVHPGQILTNCPELETTTMAELGGFLPATRKAYRFHRPNVGTMRRLGQLQSDRNLQRRPGTFIAAYLAAALAELDGEDFGPVERNDKRAAAVAQLPTGDVLTLIVAFAHAQNPRGIALTGAGCGACGASWDTVRINLGELEVQALPAGLEVEPAALVGLWSGFQAHGREVRAALVHPPTWAGTFGGLSKEAWSNPMALRAAEVQGSIVGLDSLPKVGRLGLEVLDELMSHDLDLLDEAQGLITASVSLSLGVDCPACGAYNETALDWRNLGFTSGPAGL